MQLNKQAKIGGSIALAIAAITVFFIYNTMEKRPVELPEPSIVVENKGIDWKKTGETVGKVYRFSSGFIRGARDKNE